MNFFLPSLIGFSSCLFSLPGGQLKPQTDKANSLSSEWSQRGEPRCGYFPVSSPPHEDDPWTPLGSGSQGERTRPQALGSKLLLLLCLPATCLSLGAKVHFSQPPTSWGWFPFTMIFLEMCTSRFLVHSKLGVPWRLGWGQSLSSFRPLGCCFFCTPASSWGTISHHHDDAIMEGAPGKVLCCHRYRCTTLEHFPLLCYSGSII